VKRAKVVAEGKRSGPAGHRSCGTRGLFSLQTRNDIVPELLIMPQMVATVFGPESDPRIRWEPQAEVALICIKGIQIYG
jgi:hypothetical protein